MKNLGEINSVYNEKGFAVIFLAILMVALASLVGMAIDVAYSYLVKTELQNAADASALAGAGVIYPSNSSPPPTTFPAPDWKSAKTVATALAKQNKAAGANLSDTDIVSIQVGYWNLGQNPPDMQPQSITPTGKCSASATFCTSNANCAATEACLMQDIPAVQVTVEKAGLATFFARVVGWNSFSPRATAVAGRGFPLGGQGIVPVAVTKCMTDYYFSHPELIGSTINIWGPYDPLKDVGCNTGQWTSLTLNSNDVPTISGLMYGSIPSPSLDFGDNIWIQPGTKDALYQDVDKDFVGKTVFLPVVQDVAVSTNSKTPIMGFAAFQIDGVVTSGSDKQIFGHFLAYYTDPGATTPGGPSGSTVTPPVLIR